MKKLKLREVKSVPRVIARKYLGPDLRAPGCLTPSSTPQLQQAALLAGGGKGADSWLLIHSVLFSALALLQPNEQMLHYAFLTLQTST